MNLKITITATDLIKNIFQKKKLSKILTNLIEFLEGHFGSQILLDIPSELQEFHPDLLTVLSTASQLKSLEIIENITPNKKMPDEPFAYQFYTSSTGRAHGTGIDFLSEEKAAWKSLAEATERFLWYNSEDFYSNKTIRASFNQLNGPVLDIFSLAGFSQEQKKQFSILSFDKNSLFSWIKARSLTSTKKVWCPIQLFSRYYTHQNVKRFSFLTKKEPMLRWIITTGLATGRCLEEATTKGILEVIERDAFMISYLNQISPPVLDLDYLSKQDKDIAKIIQKFQRYNLEIHLLQLPSDFSVFIIAAVIIDRTGIGPAFSIGASADFDLKTCILDALSESLIVRISLRDEHKREVNTNNMNRMGRLIYWSNPKNLSKIEFFINGPKVNINLDKNFFQLEKDSDYKKYYTAKLDLLTNELKKLKYAGCAVELTTKPIKKLSLRSVQVVIPQLQPMHLDESIPYFSGSRLKEIPKKFGYLPKEPVNQEPHPFP